MRWLDHINDSINGANSESQKYELEQTLGDSEGQGSLACYSPWGHKESDIA